MEDIYLKIKNLCPNCGGNISSHRLVNSLPCELDVSSDEESDLTKIKEKDVFYDNLYSILKNKGRLMKFEEYYKLYQETKSFYDFFISVLGSEPWSIQLMWFKRILKRKSFSIVAPTGVGKSTFISVASLYLANKYNYKILIVLPTRILVKQTYDNLVKFSKKVNLNIRILSKVNMKKLEFEEKLLKRDYDILVISNQFLSKSFDKIKSQEFDIVFVDDVDAFFKGSKNIEKTLQLLGYKEEEIRLAKEILDLKLAGKLDFNSNIYKEFLKIKEKKRGILILSSATGSLRGKRTLLYRELLSFSVGSSSSKLRNIIDAYVKVKDEEELNVLLKILNILKDGIIIFVPKNKGIEYAEYVYNFLIDKGYKVGLVHSNIKEVSDIIQNFAEKNINILIGIAHPYGILVRGIDLPTRIKYVIFLGIPTIKINISNLEKDISDLLTLSKLLIDILDNEYEKSNLRKLVNNINKNLKKLSSEAMILISDAFVNNKELDGFSGYLLKMIRDLYNIVSQKIKDTYILEKLNNHPDVSIKIENGHIYANVVDVKTYIQASGRASRLYAGGISKGLSIVFVDDEKLLKSLDSKLRWFLS